MKLKCFPSLLPYLYILVYKEKNMAVEKPLNVEAFFMSRQAIASEHGSKLELQTMSRVREHLVEDQQAPKTKKAEEQPKKTK